MRAADTAAMLASSDVMVLVYAFGAGIVGIGALLAGILAMLEDADRKAMLNLVRHPVRVIFSEDSDHSDG
jgi:hypothetical protein